LSAGCPLCEAAGGRVVVQAPAWRLVHAQEEGFPAFYRVVWQEHVREISHLPRGDRILLGDVLATVEGALLAHLNPTKINVASLGNAVPHLHWHVIARFDWDSHFPGAVWAAAQRPADDARVAQVEAALPALEEQLRAALAPL
jgi:diadenosine tetraphosphate (Ap4A) HIT family hydrolase